MAAAGEAKNQGNEKTKRTEQQPRGGVDWLWRRSADPRVAAAVVALFPFSPHFRSGDEFSLSLSLSLSPGCAAATTGI